MGGFRGAKNFQHRPKPDPQSSPKHPKTRHCFFFCGMVSDSGFQRQKYLSKCRSVTPQLAMLHWFPSECKQCSYGLKKIASDFFQLEGSRWGSNPENPTEDHQFDNFSLNYKLIPSTSPLIYLIPLISPLNSQFPLSTIPSCSHGILLNSLDIPLVS